MSVANTLYRAALLAYPAGYRRARGAEILGTLGEAGPSVSARELSGLVIGGVRERGIEAGGGTIRGSWAEGCRLAALVLLVLTAASGAYAIGWELWYVRLGMNWPYDMAGVHLAGMSDTSLARWLVCTVIPLASAAAICRGRVRLAMAGPIVLAALYLTGSVGFPGAIGLGYPADQPWLGNLIQLCDALFLAAPAVLLWAGRPRGAERPQHHSLLWLGAPLVLGVLHLAFYATTITFWPLGVLACGWFLASRYDPRLGVAAFGVLLPTVIFALPTALGSPQYEYAIAVTAAGAILAAASLASALTADSVS